MSERTTRVLVSRERARKAAGRVSAARVLIILGWSFILVGVVDLALLWIPLRLESVAWEFATVGRTLDALPMPALGLGLLAYGSSRHPGVGSGRLRALAIVFGALALLLVALSALLLTAVPAVLGQTPSEALAGARRAAIRHGAQAIVYPLAFAAAAFALWRRES